MAAALFGSRSLAALGASATQFGVAAVRLVGLVWVSLLMTPRTMPPSPRRRAPAARPNDPAVTAPRSHRRQTADREEPRAGAIQRRHSVATGV